MEQIEILFIHLLLVFNQYFLRPISKCNRHHGNALVGYNIPYVFGEILKVLLLHCSHAYFLENIYISET